MVYKTCKNLLQACLCVEQNWCHKSSSLSHAETQLCVSYGEEVTHLHFLKDLAVIKLL